jgi:GntR family transcriptional regulator
VSSLTNSAAASGVTLYARVASVLRGKIAAGNWAVGEMIPTIAQLSREYGTAKITIRQAVKLLSDEGLLQSQRGKGTFVSAAPLRFPQDSIERMREARKGVKERSKTLFRKQLDEIPPLIACGDRVATGKFDFIKRVRIAGNAALFMIEIFIEQRFHKRLGRDHESAIPAVKLLNAHSEGSKVETTVTVTSADAETASLLQCEFAMPIAQVIRIVRNGKNEVVLAQRVTYRADVFAMQFVQEGKEYLVSYMGSNVRAPSRRLLRDAIAQ